MQLQVTVKFQILPRESLRLRFGECSIYDRRCEKKAATFDFKGLGYACSRYRENNRTVSMATLIVESRETVKEGITRKVHTPSSGFQCTTRP